MAQLKLQRSAVQVPSPAGFSWLHQDMAKGGEEVCVTVSLSLSFLLSVSPPGFQHAPHDLVSSGKVRLSTPLLSKLPFT